MSNPRSTPTTQNVLRQIEDFTRRFVVFPTEDAYPVVAAWVLHTHAFDAAYSTPYLYVHSPEMQSGKTRVMETVELLVHNPAPPVANVSAASLYKQIEAEKPTLFIDEVDAIYGGNKDEALRGVLNSGYKHNGFVIRADPNPQSETGIIRYSTFCPKMIAGIDNGALPGTIIDRSIPIRLKRARKDERGQIERMIARKIEPQAEELRTVIEEWVAANLDALRDAEPTIEDDMSDRQWDISEPLIAIAEQISAEEGKRLRKALVTLFKGAAPGESEQTKVLRAINEFITTNPERKRVLTAELCDHLGGDWTPKRLANVLAPFDIAPKNVRVPALGQGKGFSVDQFEDAFQRYL